MTNHPGTRGREALRATSGFRYRPRRLLAGAAATARTMRSLVFGDRLRRMSTALIGGDRIAPIRGHAEEIRCGQDHPRRGAFALRTILRIIAFRHRPHIREWTAIVAKIFIDWHDVFPAQVETKTVNRMRGGIVRSRPASVAQGIYLSCESGIWMSPLMCFTGPADDGMMSKSKISVGNHSVAHAFGTSTTPEMWPWHGAVPRIE